MSSYDGNIDLYCETRNVLLFSYSSLSEDLQLSTEVFQLSFCTLTLLPMSYSCQHYRRKPLTLPRAIACLA